MEPKKYPTKNQEEYLDSMIRVFLNQIQFLSGESKPRRIIKKDNYKKMNEHKEVSNLIEKLEYMTVYFSNICNAILKSKYEEIKRYYPRPESPFFKKEYNWEDESFKKEYQYIAKYYQLPHYCRFNEIITNTLHD